MGCVQVGVALGCVHVGVAMGCVQVGVALGCVHVGVIFGCVACVRVVFAVYLSLLLPFNLQWIEGLVYTASNVFPIKDNIKTDIIFDLQIFHLLTDKFYRILTPLCLACDVNYY